MNTVQRDGLLLAGSAVVGMALMNSPWAAGFAHFLQSPVVAGASVKLLINDALMVIFFLAVGIEIKHEWRHGALATPQARVLPLGAALGGMAVPAAMYVAFNWHQPANLAGWAVPSATDIAFALGLMALAAPRTRPALLAFLTAVAVLDDLGAIVIIALFYTDQLSAGMLGLAVLCIAALALVAYKKVLSVWPYLLLATLLWLCVVKSGVHATLAGVIAGLLIPSPAQGRNPSHTIAHAIKPFISWWVLPLFGVVNAGVTLSGVGWASVLQPVTLGVAMGLLLGKPIGIMLGAWLTSKLAGGLPSGLKLMDYLAPACFCGVGFTMALFIGTLAFDAGTTQADAAKLGVLMGTVMAFGLGALVARWRS
jgi:Na+:H+ antiporter, NhaA family